MEIVDKRQKQPEKDLNLSPGSIIEDESGIWLIHIYENDNKTLSCIESFYDDWLNGEIVLDHINDEDLINWFDTDAHNLKNAKLVIE